MKIGGTLTVGGMETKAANLSYGDIQPENCSNTKNEAASLEINPSSLLLVYYAYFYFALNL